MVFPFVWRFYLKLLQTTSGNIKRLPQNYCRKRQHLITIVKYSLAAIFLRWYWNSIVVALLTTLSVCFFSSICRILYSQV